MPDRRDVTGLESDRFAEIVTLRPFASFLAHKYYIAGADRDDVEAEAFYGLAKAIRDYDPSLGLFVPFARVCMARQVITAIKTAQREKHGPLNNAVTHGLDEDGELRDVLELIADARSDPAYVVAARHEIKDLLRRIVCELTPRERRAVVGFAAGLSYTEIAEAAGVSRVKAVDNDFARARRKLRRAA